MTWESPPLTGSGELPDSEKEYFKRLGEELARHQALVATAGLEPPELGINSSVSDNTPEDSRYEPDEINKD